MPKGIYVGRLYPMVYCLFRVSNQVSTGQIVIAWVDSKPQYYQPWNSLYQWIKSSEAPKVGKEDSKWEWFLVTTSDIDYSFFSIQKHFTIHTSPHLWGRSERLCHLLQRKNTHPQCINLNVIITWQRSGKVEMHNNSITHL